MSLPNKRAIKQAQTDITGLTVDLGALGITDLTDVVITSLANNEILKWNESEGEWQNAADATA